jgi:hypothetical protein
VGKQEEMQSAVGAAQDFNRNISRIVGNAVFLKQGK